MTTTPPPPPGGDPNYPPQAPPPGGAYPPPPPAPAGYPTQQPPQGAYPVGGGGGGGGPDLGEFARRHLRTPETKEFFKSSEFAIWLITAIGVLIAGLSADDIEPSLVWTLITVLSFAYIISRGIAKSGTKHHDHDHDGHHH
jgi:hypothetical protein